MPDSIDSRADALRRLGFVDEPVGSHGSRSISLDEIRKLVDATEPTTPYDEMRRLVLDDNILGKQSLSSRMNTLRRLREFYALKPEVPVYSALRFFWNCDASEQLMLALLCASARDPVLRVSAEVVLPWPVDQRLPKRDLEDRLSSEYPGRYSEGIVASTVRRLLSSWTQSGHLKGHTAKIRTRAVAGPASTAYALYLGYLTGLRGNALFDTIWVRILDAPLSEVHEHAFEASRRGWIDYRSAGAVVDVGFDAVPGHEAAL